MEPLHSYNGEHYEEEHIKPHVVYRKDASKKTVDYSTTCETSGKQEDTQVLSFEWKNVQL